MQTAETLLGGQVKAKPEVWICGIERLSQVIQHDPAKKSLYIIPN